MSELQFSDSVVVAVSADALYDMVSDVTRMGEWSPICVACWWDEGDSAREGAWFTGRNQTPERTWETRSQVTVADRGREFTFRVGGEWVHWSYTFEPLDEHSTRLTESWAFLPAGLTRFATVYGDQAQAQIENRRAAAYRGIPETLAAVKQAAER